VLSHVAAIMLQQGLPKVCRRLVTVLPRQMRNLIIIREQSGQLGNASLLEVLASTEVFFVAKLLPHHVFARDYLLPQSFLVEVPLNGSGTGPRSVQSELR
jgi:hypothetical protein